MEKATTCTETDGNGLERQKTNRKPVHGAANASKNRWRVLGTGKGGQRCETGMPAFTTIISHLYRTACTRSSRGSGGGDKGRRKMDQGTEVCRWPSDGSEESERSTDNDG